MVISNSFHKCTCHSRVRQTDRQIKIVLEIPNLPQLNSNNESPSNRLPSFTATHSVHQRTCRHIWLCFHANHLRTSPHAARQTIITIIISHQPPSHNLQHNLPSSLFHTPHHGGGCWRRRRRRGPRDERRVLWKVLNVIQLKKFLFAHVCSRRDPPLVFAIMSALSVRLFSSSRVMFY